jgi:hypothetical protein
MSLGYAVLSRLIVSGAIHWPELAFTGNAALQMLADLVLPKPSTSSDGKRSRHGDEKQNALHPLILESEPCNARELQR